MANPLLHFDGSTVQIRLAAMIQLFIVYFSTTFVTSILLSIIGRSFIIFISLIATPLVTAVIFYFLLKRSLPLFDEPPFRVATQKAPFVILLTAANLFLTAVLLHIIVVNVYFGTDSYPMVYFFGGLLGCVGLTPPRKWKWIFLSIFEVFALIFVIPHAVEGSHSPGHNGPVNVITITSLFFLLGVIACLAVPLSDLFLKAQLSLDKLDFLLGSVFPSQVAARMLALGYTFTGSNSDKRLQFKSAKKTNLLVDDTQDVAVIFVQLVNFFSAFGVRSFILEPMITFSKLNEMYTILQNTSKKYKVEEIKISGAETYVATSGVPNSAGKVENATNAISCAIEMLARLEDFAKKYNSPVQFQVGVHIGRVTAGVCSKARLAYDIWGDTVNYASRVSVAGLVSKSHRIDASSDETTSDTMSPLLGDRVSPATEKARISRLVRRTGIKNALKSSPSFSHMTFGDSGQSRIVISPELRDVLNEADFKFAEGHDLVHLGTYELKGIGEKELWTVKVDLPKVVTEPETEAPSMTLDVEEDGDTDFMSKFTSPLLDFIELCRQSDPVNLFGDRPSRKAALERKKTSEEVEVPLVRVRNTSYLRGLTVYNGVIMILVAIPIIPIILFADYSDPTTIGLSVIWGIQLMAFVVATFLAIAVISRATSMILNPNRREHLLFKIFPKLKNMNYQMYIFLPSFILLMTYFAYGIFYANGATDALTSFVLPVSLVGPAIVLHPYKDQTLYLTAIGATIGVRLILVIFGSTVGSVFPSSAIFENLKPIFMDEVWFFSYFFHSLAASFFFHYVQRKLRKAIHMGYSLLVITLPKAYVSRFRLYQPERITWVSGFFTYVLYLLGSLGVQSAQARVEEMQKIPDSWQHLTEEDADRDGFGSVTEEDSGMVSSLSLSSPVQQKSYFLSVDFSPLNAVLVSDIANFTSLARERDPGEVVSYLNTLYSSYDDLWDMLRLHKITTEGDSYIGCAIEARPVSTVVSESEFSGTDTESGKDQADRFLAMVVAALIMKHIHDEQSIDDRLGLRIGVASGPVFGGLLGAGKLAYSMWGPAIHSAQALESITPLNTVLLCPTTTRMLVSDSLLAEGAEIPESLTISIPDSILTGLKYDYRQLFRSKSISLNLSEASNNFHACITASEEA